MLNPDKDPQEVYAARQARYASVRQSMAERAAEETRHANGYALNEVHTIRGDELHRLMAETASRAINAYRGESPTKED